MWFYRQKNNWKKKKHNKQRNWLLRVCCVELAALACPAWKAVLEIEVHDELLYTSIELATQQQQNTHSPPVPRERDPGQTIC